MNNREDNTVALLYRAIVHFGVKITKKSVREVLFSHSDYPTLKSICDSLNQWNINNYPLKYKPEELREISFPYIVHFKGGGGKLGFVIKKTYDSITFYDFDNKKYTTSFDDFIHRCSGAIIVLYPDEKSGENDFHRKYQEEFIPKAILPLIIVTFFFICLSILLSNSSHSFFNLYNLALLLLNIIGIVLSVFLVLQEFEISTSFTDKLCHLNKSVDCNMVLHNKASKIYGWFGWADIGMIYFSCNILLLLQSFIGRNFFIVNIVSILSIPFPLYSFYYQKFIIKKYCPLCLGVQIVLIIQFIILLQNFSNFSFSTSNLIYSTLSFLCIVIVYTLSILFFKTKAIHDVYFNRYLSFKRKKKVFESLLFEQEQYNIPINDNSLILGSKNAKIKVSAFLSINCSHCARAFEKIKLILDSKIDACFNIILIEPTEKVIKTLLFYKNIEKEAISLLDQLYNKNTYSKSMISDNLCVPDIDDISKKIKNDNLILYSKLNLIGTPTFFINGFKLPVQYDIEDIIIFSDLCSKDSNLECNNIHDFNCSRCKNLS